MTRISGIHRRTTPETKPEGPAPYRSFWGLPGLLFLMFIPPALGLVDSNDSPTDPPPHPMARLLAEYQKGERVSGNCAAQRSLHDAYVQNIRANTTNHTPMALWETLLLQPLSTNTFVICAGLAHFTDDELPKPRSWIIEQLLKTPCRWVVQVTISGHAPYGPAEKENPFSEASCRILLKYLTQPEPLPVSEIAQAAFRTARQNLEDQAVSDEAHGLTSQRDVLAQTIREFENKKAWNNLRETMFLILVRNSERYPWIDEILGKDPPLYGDRLFYAEAQLSELGRFPDREKVWAMGKEERQRFEETLGLYLFNAPDEQRLIKFMEWAMPFDRETPKGADWAVGCIAHLAGSPHAGRYPKFYLQIICKCPEEAIETNLLFEFEQAVAWEIERLSIGAPESLPAYFDQVTRFTEPLLQHKHKTLRTWAIGFASRLSAIQKVLIK